MRRVIGIIVLLAVVSAGVVFWAQGHKPDIPLTELEGKYMTEADRFVDVDGVRVRVREEGPRSAPPVILLHGFSFSLESWDGWAPALAEDYRVIRYDLLGHGLTGPDPQQRYNPAERAVFLGQVMDALEIEQAVIAGNSLGGQIAWNFAAANPGRVEKMVLVAPGAFSINGVTENPVQVPVPLAFYFRTVPEVGLKASFAMLFGDDKKVTDERLALARDMMLAPGNGDAMVHHLEEFTLPDPTQTLGQITAPTLIQWGSADEMIPVAHGTLIKRAMPNARLVIYDGVGHVPHEEIPAISVATALSFLAGEAGE